jgi:hypothetical protein
MSDPDSSKPSDMVRRYVVEVAKKPTTPNTTKDDLNWVSRGSYDTPEEAARRATDEKQHIGKDIVGVRIRQFWVQSFLTQAQAKARAQNVIIPDAPLVDYVCMDHPEEHARATSTPRCPVCRSPMVTKDFYSQVKEL